MNPGVAIVGWLDPVAQTPIIGDFLLVAKTEEENNRHRKEVCNLIVLFLQMFVCSVPFFLNSFFGLFCSFFEPT